MNENTEPQLEIGHLVWRVYNVHLSMESVYSNTFSHTNSRV